MAGDEPNITGFAILPFAGGETVYKWFDQGKGPAQSTGPASASWRLLAQNHNSIAEIINKAVRDSGAAWEGQAGDAARSNTSPLATWADVTGQSATDAGKTTDAIGQAYSDAKNKMQQPPSVPDKPFYNDYVPWDTDYDDKLEANQKVSNANVEAFNTYASAVSASTQSMPTFTSPDPNDAKMEEQRGTKPPDKVEYPPPGGRPPGSNPPPGTGRPPGSGDDTNLSGWKPPGSGDDTNPSKVDPRYPMPPPGNDDWRNRPPGTGDPNIPPGGGGRWDPNNPNDPRNRPGGPNDPRNRPGGGPPGMAGRGGGGGGGAGGGMKPPGIGGAAAAGLGKGPGGMGSGFGGAAGVAGEGRGGAGGFGPAGAGAAGGRGAAGAAGMAGGMGAGAGKGQGDEDKEHKSASYLQETEDIFGDGTMVAPPVIGG